MYQCIRYCDFLSYLHTVHESRCNLLCDICYFSSTRYSKPPRYFRMKNNKSFILISLCQTVKTGFLCWTYKSLCKYLFLIIGVFFVRGAFVLDPSYPSKHTWLLKILHVWLYCHSNQLKVIHGANHFTKLFIVTCWPSDKLLCKILCCDLSKCKI
jgi:hypothetical protein